ncbi:MAG TPA: flagellar protein FlgN [Bacillales bacterium]|nr:flagellar protein FlgN [Bacillales bacterium]
MTVEAIVRTMVSLVDVHAKMTEMAREKTEILKEADVEALEAQLKKEEPYIEKIKELETLRVKQMHEWLEENGQTMETATSTSFLSLFAGEAKEKLTAVFADLTRSVNELKAQNRLNQQLIEQSLQFVNVTADLLQPGNEPVGYGKSRQTGPNQRQNQRSVFDSKA